MDISSLDGQRTGHLPCAREFWHRGLLAISSQPDRAPEAVLMWAGGDIDLSNAMLISEVVDIALGNGRRRMSMDVAEVDFAGCAAINAFIDAHARCQKAQGLFRLTGVGSHLAKVFRIAGVDGIFTAGSTAA